MLQLVTILAIIFLAAVDQIIKIFIQNWLEPIGNYILVNNFIQFNYVENTGAAFGSFKNSTLVLIVFTLTILVIGIVFLLSKKIKFGLMYVSLVILISGGFGNLIDRIFRGYVVDYIDFLFVKFAVFNFADMLVTVGAFLLGIYLIIDIINDNKKKKLLNCKEDIAND